MAAGGHSAQPAVGRALRSLVLAAAAALAGCALAPPGTAPDAGAGLPQRVELREVPFFPQDEYQCGPAALATALTFAGAARLPAQLVEQVYLPQRQGSLQPEMLAATRRAGLVAYPIAPRRGALFQEVAAGHPVVVLQNLRFSLFPRWHYAVVVGFDRERRLVVLRSGTEERLVMDEEDFEQSWAKAGHWAFAALPPATLPATAAEPDYVGAAASLERVDPAAAATAYRTALARWPANLVARLGAGNAAYTLHRLAEAEQSYRAATQAHPDSADAWNNLAQVLHEGNRNGEAAAAARRAVALGGPREATYRATLEAIEAGATH